MSERESNLLPPAGLDAEVVEAVDALRPDLVPLPADGLSAALSELVDGPLALGPSGAEAEEARRLAEALAASEPVDPETLGPEAYTALAALRPSALPVPGLDAAELAGPVPSPEERVRSHLEKTRSVPKASSPLPPSAVARTPPPAPANQRRWVLPGLSAVAMVAAVLVVVLPAGPGLMQQESPFSAPVEALDEAVSAPMAETEALEEAVVADTPTFAAAPPPRASTPPPGDGAASSAPAARPKAKPAPEAVVTDRAVARAAAPSSLKKTAEAAPTRSDAASRVPTEDPLVGLLGTRGPAASPSASDSIAADAFADDAAAASLDVGEWVASEYEAELAEPEPQAAPEPPEAAAPEGGLQAPEPIAERAGRPQTAGAEAVFGGRASGTVDRDVRAPTKLRSRAAAEATLPAEAPGGDRLAVLRRRVLALPSPDRPSPSSPADVAAYAALDAAVAQRDPQAQRAALQTLGNSRQPDVVADAHLRLASLARDSGDSDRAFALLARGLGAPGTSGSWRAALLAAQGRLLDERGDAQGARRRYQQALDAR